MFDNCIRMCLRQAVEPTLNENQHMSCVFMALNCCEMQDRVKTKGIAGLDEILDKLTHDEELVEGLPDIIGSLQDILRSAKAYIADGSQ